GGTGMPKSVISARFAPFPPSNSLIWPLPSAVPPPKKYTRFVMYGSTSLSFVPLRDVRAQIRHPVAQGRHLPQQSQPVAAHVGLGRHHQHFRKQAIQDRK